VDAWQAAHRQPIAVTFACFGAEMAQRYRSLL
jgi:hypothetical protein